MREPTYKQHKLLEEIYLDGSIALYNNQIIDDYWELVRNGYLKNLASLMVKEDWIFKITEQGEQYLINSDKGR